MSTRRAPEKEQNEGWIKKIFALAHLWSRRLSVFAKGLFISPSELFVSLLSLSLHPGRAHM